MEISLQDAKRLFKDAHDYELGHTKSLPMDHEIREIAQQVWPRVGALHISHVCREIFRVIAADAMSEKGYADVVWNVADVHTLRPEMTEDQAHEFLQQNEKHLRDRSIEHGWEVMESLLGMSGL